MGYLTPALTENGKEMLRMAIQGKGLTFTKIVFGDGTPTASDELVTAVKHPVVTLGLSDIIQYRGYVILSGSFDNSGLETGFYMKELGVYAKDSDDVEALYAYRFNSAEIDYMPDKASGRTVQRNISIVVAIGELSDVDAVIVESDAYVSKETFQAHLNDTNNPHKITKKDVGLDKVENKAPSDMTVSFTENSTLTKIRTGESLKVLFGKILALFSSFDLHVKSKNPHGLKISDLNGAAANHKHSASDITAGVMPLSMGGTGVTTKENLKKLVLANPTFTTGSLVASEWSGNVYSFENTYKSEKYNMNVSISPNATEEQQKAYADARLAGSATGNQLTSLGTVPSVDIPILIKLTEVV